MLTSHKGDLLIGIHNMIAKIDAYTLNICTICWSSLIQFGIFLYLSSYYLIKH